MKYNCKPAVCRIVKIQTVHPLRVSVVEEKLKHANGGESRQNWHLRKVDLSKQAHRVALGASRALAARRKVRQSTNLA